MNIEPLITELAGPGHLGEIAMCKMIHKQEGKRESWVYLSGPS